MKKTILDNLAVDATGGVLVRFRKQQWDGDVLVSQEYHRTVIEADTAPSEQIEAVNAHLLAMEEAQVSEADIALIEAFVSAKRA